MPKPYIHFCVQNQAKDTQKQISFPQKLYQATTNKCFHLTPALSNVQVVQLLPYNVVHTRPKPFNGFRNMPINNLEEHRHIPCFYYACMVTLNFPKKFAVTNSKPHQAPETNEQAQKTLESEKVIEPGEKK